MPTKTLAKRPVRKRGSTPETEEQERAAERRRIEVAALLLSKHSYRQIGERLGVSHTTITRDVEHIREQWRVRAGAKYQEHVAEEVAKLDGMERVLIVRAFQGDPASVLAQLKIMERRARLLALDAPFKFEQVIPDDQMGALLSKAVEGMLAELGVKPGRKDVGAVVSRHLTAVAELVEGSAA